MMDLETPLSMTQQESVDMVASAARDFAEKYVRPHIMEWDEKQHFPVDVMRLAGQHGFLGVLIPESYGGSGLGYHEYVAIIEEFSKVDPSIGLSIAAHNSLCLNHIYTFGNESQRVQWVPKLA